MSFLKFKKPYKDGVANVGVDPTEWPGNMLTPPKIN